MSDTGPKDQDAGNIPDTGVVGEDMSVLAPTLDRPDQPAAPDATATTATATDDGRPAPSMLIEGETKDELFNRVILPEVEVMWRVAMSLTRNRADAEDVVQESLLRAYRALHTFDGRYPRAWLLTIVRNTERNRHRRRRPELLRDPDIVEERGPSTEPDEVEAIAEAGDFDAAVRASLEQLPETFRGVIELVDVDGLSYQEAADVLEVPLGTVMSRLHRARRRIRELLIPLGYGPYGLNPNSDTNASATATDESSGQAPSDQLLADEPAKS